jgi:hypothetical protein
MRSALVLVAAVLAFDAVGAPAHAQLSGSSPQRPRYVRPSHKFELTGHYGYVWTASRTVVFEDRVGDLDVANSEMWGVQLDIVLRPDAALTLLYNRQDSDLTFKEGATKETVGPISVEYLQIGGQGGTRQGNWMPFTQVTLGGTRYSDLELADDIWKFSLTFGIGAKYFISERIALRAQGRLPYTFFGGGVGFGFGTGGGYVTAGGTGYLQADLSGGLTLLL